MFKLNGKYNSCKVFTDNVDNETISQLTNLLNQSSIEGSRIRIMPDTHAGAGCVIGTTMTLTDKVIPNLVGVDIGCGMLAVRLDETEVDMTLLDDVIHEYIPAGFTIHENAIATSNVYNILAPVDVEKALKSLGTLGGGNHFIELDRDSNNNLWLVVHTGSRHLGLEVCSYYQKLAYENLKHKATKPKVDELIATLKSEGREREIEQAIKSLKVEPVVSKDLAYVEGVNFEHYLHDMALAQEHAAINRRTIVEKIVKQMNWHITDEIHTIHNYIDMENQILRKGAVSAMKNESLIIPMNMRDGSLICKGKGNPDWNCSAPHGAGRIMSRGQAKEKIAMKDYEHSMAGIYTTCVSTATIDESPMVYKPMDEIMKNVQDTVEIVDVIKPIYNFKAN